MENRDNDEIPEAEDLDDMIFQGREDTVSDR